MSRVGISSGPGDGMNHPFFRRITPNYGLPSSTYFFLILRENISDASLTYLPRISFMALHIVPV